MSLAADLSTVWCSDSNSSAFQGGAEHKVPVVISKIFKDQVGKAILQFSQWQSKPNRVKVRIF